jgi:hypothetical protein
MPKITILPKQPEDPTVHENWKRYKPPAIGALLYQIRNLGGFAYAALNCNKKAQNR